MNDCRYCMINACVSEDCMNCNKYFSANDQYANLIYEVYQADVEEALQPVYEKWRNLFETNKLP